MIVTKFFLLKNTKSPAKSMYNILYDCSEQPCDIVYQKFWNSLDDNKNLSI